MILRSISLLGFALALGACTDEPSADVLNTPTNTVVYKTTKCEVPNMLGSCDKVSCKADAKSDCSDAADWCVGKGHKYEGTSESGTCTRQHFEDL
jgi:hypothetical protein